MDQEAVPVQIVGGTQPKQKQSSDDFSLVTVFRGYRHKEDKTNLAPGYLVEGSRDVLTSTGGDKVASRKGYTLDGQEDSSIAPILSSYDWLTHLGYTRNLRVGNDKMQVRYVATAGDIYKTNTFTEGQVYWLDLYTPNSNYVNFADWWSSTGVRSLLLSVDGSQGVQGQLVPGWHHHVG